MAINDRIANILTCEEEDGHISYHPDKANCAMYYMCEGERKHHMPCPVKLVFNPSQNGKTRSVLELIIRSNSISDLLYLYFFIG